MAFRERRPERRGPLRPVSRPIEVDIERTGQPAGREILRTAAKTFGIVNLVIGLGGYLSPLVTGGDPGLINTGPGLLFGLFGINWLHSLAHLVIGGLGIFYSRNAPDARGYFKAMTVVFGLLTVIGLFMMQPGIYSMMGMAVNNADIWLHLVAAGVAAYFGFANRTEAVA